MGVARAENARQREVHRYYQTWLESARGYDTAKKDAKTRLHTDGSSLRPSNDKALIAFAQLGCLRLNAKRALVTLISTDRQYVLAEATKSLSLITGFTEDDEEDELWFGNASLPRSQGISGAALDPPDYTAVDNKRRTHTAPALVVDDITQVDAYKERGYAGNGVNFYCGVPIISKSGYCIGVYTVTDDKPRNGLSPAELIFLQDMAQIVMKHLEIVRNDVARSRGENVVAALDCFVKGRTTTQNAYSTRSTAVSSKVSEHDSRDTQDLPTKQFKGMTIIDANPDLLREVHESQNSVKPKNGRPKSLSQSSAGIESSQVTTSETDPVDESPETIGEGEPDTPNAMTSNKSKVEHIFARAANILRECTGADGVVFYDAAPANHAKRSEPSKFRLNRETSESTSSTDSDESNTEFMGDTSSSGSSTDSDGSTDSQSNMLKTKGSKCALLGYSLDISLQSTANSNTIKTLGLTERSLANFIRRYPRGKTFFYGADGGVSSSEGETSDTSMENKASATTIGRALRYRSKRNSTKAVAAELIRVVPGARNVIWLPLWDFSKERWSAGMFVWSRRPDRLLVAQDDLAYFKTFGSSIVMEVSRADAHFADEAKSTFIANVSHELRSPLHGILGALEFLHETSLDAFQSSMTLAAETCAKTLLDTVEHVLDHAKINQMSAKYAKRVKARVSDSVIDGKSDSSLTDKFDLATVVEEAVEAVYVGQTFRDPAHPHKHDFPAAEAESNPDESDSTKIENIQRGSNKFSGAVKVILKVEKTSNWWTQCQPGAIRRVVMNILGNALKYTDRGTIMFSLATIKDDSQATTDHQTVCMTVKDTGRGMSRSFLQNHAFTPFSQESQFSVGTGLGLSIVRQIVNSLKGRIELQSKKGAGTEIKVFLKLPLIQAIPVLEGPESILPTVMLRTGRLSMCILDPGLEVHHQGPKLSRESVEAAIQEMAENWFGMKVTKANSFKGVDTDFFVYAEPPPIEYLLKHHGHHERSTEIPLIIMATNAFESASLAANGIHQLTSLGRILEIISQPCGPQKFGHAIHRCLKRLDSLAQRPNNFSRNEAVDLKASGEPMSEDGRGQSASPSGESSRSNQDGVPQARREMVDEDLDGSGAAFAQSEIDRSEEAEPNVSTSSTPQTASQEASHIDTTRGSAWSDAGESESKSPVLLVDDNDINLNLLIAFMKKAQHPYEKAKDGMQAVNAYKQACETTDKRFKYILMDISMPVKDGIAATREIRALEKSIGLKDSATIIALTGLGAKTTQDEMFRAGADYYLTKPVKFKDLMELFKST